MEHPRDPGDKLLFDLLRKAGTDGGEAYSAAQAVRDVAGQNIIAAMDARIADLKARSAAQAADLQAQVADLRAEIRNIYRFIGCAGVAPGLFATAIMFAYQAGRGG